MKKLFVLGAFLTLVLASASAQGPGPALRNQRVERGFDKGDITRGEKFRMHKNEKRFKHERRKASRDGRISHSERRKLHKMKRHNRHDSFRFRHNGRKR